MRHLIEIFITLYILSLARVAAQNIGFMSQLCTDYQSRVEKD